MSRACSKPTQQPVNNRTIQSMFKTHKAYEGRSFSEAGQSSCEVFGATWIGIEKIGKTDAAATCLHEKVDGHND